MISNVIEANMKKVEWKSEANQDIEAFTEVVRNQDYVFSKVPLDAITELQKTIAGIETEPPEVVAEAIRQWYLDYDYEDVRDAVLLEEREIVRVPRTKPENEENTVENRYQLLQEELEKLKEKKMKSNGLTYRELQFQTLKFLLKPESP